MSYWNDIVVCVCVALAVFLAWKEYRRPNPLHLFLRIVVSAIAVAALACLSLPILVTRQRKIQQPETVILLTEGFQPGSIRKLMNHPGINSTIYTTDPSLLQAANQFSPHLITAENAPAIMAQYQMVQVFGYGLAGKEQTLIQPEKIVLHTPPAPAGFTAAGWLQNIIAGEKLQVQGTYTNNTASAVKLVLTGLHTSLDSVMVPAKTERLFSVNAVPKLTGRAVYGLAAISGKDTLEQEDIPVEIMHGEKLKVLVLAASPDFDNKFLKSWLSANNYAVVSLTTISKNKFEKTFMNTGGLSAGRLTAAVLSNFDVVVSDAATLTAMAAPELSLIKWQVQQKGMGLVVKADSLTTRSFYTAAFPFASAAGNAGKNIIIHLQDTAVRLPPLQIAQPIFLKSQPGARPLVQDEQNRAFASSSLYGSGKIVLTTVTSSYAWALAGNNEGYQAFWSFILQRAAKNKVENASWQTSPALPVVQQPLHICLQTAHAGIVAITVDGTAVSPRQHPLLPFQWQGIYWPRSYGWHNITSPGAPNHWVYVYREGRWNSVNATQKLLATRNFVSGYARQKKAVPLKNEVTEKVPVPRFYFFMLFMLCCCYLWVEQKTADR